MSHTRRGFRARILHFLDDPYRVGVERCYQYWPDGLLVIGAGLVEQVGDAQQLLPNLPTDFPIQHHPEHLLLPGLVDCHVHYPQTEMIAAPGEQLLDWLQHYTYPTECQFGNRSYARQCADFFLQELLRNGTTSALVFATVHPQSVDAFFQAAQQRRLRMICGKVMMDQNAPDALCETPEQAYQQSRELIQRWHQRDRLLYAITPRFAPSCSDLCLQQAGRLLAEFDQLYLHTHLAESRAEVEWVQRLFPTSQHYVDVYQRHQLLGPRSVFAHSIYLHDDELQCLQRHQASVAHCPSSNLFLGSGLFALNRFQQQAIDVGLGTDIGAGTSFSILQTAAEAYKVQQLQQHTLSAWQSYYLATLGGAKTLSLEHLIGNFEPGKEADFILLNRHATPLLQRRLQACHSLEEELFALQTLADDRLVAATYVLGQCAYVSEAPVHANNAVS